MKKISLFVCALGVASLAMAQEARVENMEVLRTPTQKVNLKSVEMDQKASLQPTNLVDAYAKKPAATAVDYYGYDYYYTDGMMHAGMKEDFYGWIPIILLPFQDSVVWNNIGGPTTWTVNNQEVATNSNEYVTGYWPFYSWYLPKTADSQSTITIGTTAAPRDTTVNWQGYMYGMTDSRQFVLCANGNSSTDGNIYMTLAGMTHPDGEEGSDLYRVGAGENGNYSYGTNLVIDGLRLDTIGIVVRNLDVMKIERILIPVYNRSGKGVSAILPEGVELKLAIYAADLEKGLIDTTEPIASTTLSADDFTSVGTGVGTLVAQFYETNILGQQVEAPLYVDGDFYVELTGYNEGNCDFGIFSDYYTPVGGTTYYRVNGNFSTIWSGGGSNLAISFDAYYPTLFHYYIYEPKLTAPIAGGVAVYEDDAEANAVAVVANLENPEDLEIEAPDWVTYEVETSLYEGTNNDPGIILIQFSADPTTEGRQDVITLNADGRTFEFTITQGEVTALEDTKFVNDGKYYNVLGQEVGEDYKGVVIHNGQKLIR